MIHTQCNRPPRRRSHTPSYPGHDDYSEGDEDESDYGLEFAGQSVSREIRHENISLRLSKQRRKFDGVRQGGAWPVRTHTRNAFHRAHMQCSNSALRRCSHACNTGAGQVLISTSPWRFSCIVPAAARAAFLQTEDLVGGQLRGLVVDASWLKSYAVGTLVVAKEAMQVGGRLSLRACLRSGTGFQHLLH